MESLLVLCFPIAFLAIVTVIEYRNPLWGQFVTAASPMPDNPKGASSAQMVFFWKSADTFRKSEASDYWNAMDLIATPNGLLVKRPFFLFGRKSAYFPWAVLIPGKTLHLWVAKRRAMRLAGTELYFSVTERFFRKHVQHYVGSAK